MKLVAFFLGMGLAGAMLGGCASGSKSTGSSASMACCGKECKDMGQCCKTDASGKATCPMGGSCCVKT